MIAQHLDSVNSARTNLISILHGDGPRPLDDATRSGWETNLQRMNNVQSKLQSDLAAANNEKAAAIAEMNTQMDRQAKANPLRAGGRRSGSRGGALGELPGQVANVLDSHSKGNCR